VLNVCWVTDFVCFEEICVSAIWGFCAIKEMCRHNWKHDRATETAVSELAIGGFLKWVNNLRGNEMQNKITHQVQITLVNKI
jgi:hypothetical protein